MWCNYSTTAFCANCIFHGGAIIALHHFILFLSMKKPMKDKILSNRGDDYFVEIQNQKMEDGMTLLQ